MERYYPFSRFLREKMGRPTYKVCVDAGFSCPNLDGNLSSDGCVYCNNRSFSPVRPQDRNSLKKQIEEGIRRQRLRKGEGSCFLVYFQSYTNTYAPVDRLEELYRTALCCEGIAGLNISTRPDCLEEEKLDLLTELAKNYFVLVEIGLQTSHDETLRRINRGHDYRCFLEAVERLRHRSIYLGGHVILGLPGETESMILETASRVAVLPLDCLKIHNLLIVQGTQLAARYRQDPFPLPDREEYISQVCRFLERLSSQTAIARCFASCPEDLLIAPLWAGDTRRLLDDIRGRLKEEDTFQGRLFHRTP